MNRLKLKDGTTVKFTTKIAVINSHGTVKKPFPGLTLAKAKELRAKYK